MNNFTVFKNCTKKSHSTTLRAKRARSIFSKKVILARKFKYWENSHILIFAFLALRINFFEWFSIDYIFGQFQTLCFYDVFTNLSDSSWMNMERIAFGSQGRPTNIRSGSGHQFVGYSFMTQQVLLLQYLQGKVGNRLDKFKVMVFGL